MKRSAASVALSLVLFAGSAWADGDDAKAPAPQPDAAASTADVVVLKDGRRLEGEIVAEDERYVSLRSGGVTRAYARDTIASLTKAPRAPGAAPPSMDPGSAAPTAPADPAVKDKKRPKGEKARDAAPLSDAAKAWLGELLARTADADETVRRSIAAAIGSMGPGAVPHVRAAEAAAADGPQKEFLGKLAGDLESRRDKRARGEPGMPGEGMRPDGAMPGQDAQGQRPGGPRRMAEETLQRLAAELELREEQKPKVASILEETMKRRFEIFRDARRDGLSADQVAERVTPLRADFLAQMKTVLDEPQYLMFEEMANRIFDPQRGQPTGPKPVKPAEPQEPAK